MSQLYLVASPGIGSPKKRYANVAAKLECVPIDERYLRLVSFAAIWIVDRSASPAAGTCVFESAHDSHAVDRPVSKGGVWVLIVQSRRIAFFCRC